MKKNPAALPENLNLLTVVGELVNCHSAVFHTVTDAGHEQSSHPGASFIAFPTILLTVEKEKDHCLDTCAEKPYLIVRTDRLSDKGYFLRVEGVVEKSWPHDERLLKVVFRAEKVQLKKEGSFSTKETWMTDDLIAGKQDSL